MLQMLNRITLIGRMEALKLSLDNTKDYSVRQLMDACERMEVSGAVYQGRNQYNRIQQELIANPLFPKVYKELTEQGVYEHTLQCWLEGADDIEDTLTDYTVGQLTKAASIGSMSELAKFEYLKYYSGETLTEEEETVLLQNLRYISSSGCRVSELTESQRMLLLKKFFMQYIVVSKETWTEQILLLEKNQMLQELLEFLVERGISFEVNSEDLNHLEQLHSDILQKIGMVYDVLSTDREWMSKFMELWLENGAVQYDLDWFARKTVLSQKEKELILSTKIGYTNALYCGQLDIPFERVREYQKGVLFYAIAHKKRHFLKLITEHFEMFESLDYNAMLFDPEFYTRCNLNTLTHSNLEDCRGNARLKSHLEELEVREYTFTELKLLRYAAPVYRALYNRLDIARVDERLIVMRQLLKNNLLPESLQEEQLDILAGKLSQKPLSMWYESRFSHIAGVSMADTLRFLLDFDILERFLPQMQSKEEVFYAIRNADMLQSYSDWQQAREEIILVDQDFWKLKEQLNLSDAFISQNESQIKQFLLSEGAEMSRIYYEYTSQKEAFRRIVQAELMGKSKELKYFGEDLEKEINYPINVAQRENWQSNRETRTKELEILETDDFYTTMRVGLLPHRTCLSYQDGMHRECVLAGFDSNKKILLAKKNGKVVGRAIIRLTKGRFHASEQVQDKELEFADLLAEGTSKQEKTESIEKLVLFLEVPYFAHINEEEQEKVQRLFVDFVTEKASLLDAVPVLACKYSGCYEKEQYVRVGYYIYISKSKSGAQYLDSFSGEATASTEGSYKQNMLLVLKEAM